MKIAGQRETNASDRPRQNSYPVSQLYPAMIRHEVKKPMSKEVLSASRWATTNQSTGPAKSQYTRGLRPSKTRAPLQVTANASMSVICAKSTEIASYSEPCVPNMTRDMASNKWAKPHQQTARISEFWIAANMRSS